MTEKRFGVLGKILVVDLTNSTIEEQEVPEEVYRKVASGLGLGAWYLYNNVPAGCDALGPDNILGITSGVLTGTGAFYAGRFEVVCKSPASNGWGDSNCGGNFAPMIKMCGYDAIFFHGVASKPVYLYVGKKGAEIRDASSYWGLNALEAENALESAHWQPGEIKPRIAVIGNAGENLSLISGICTDRGRIAARGGCGAVMGSKMLKAVVLQGNKQVKVYDFQTIKDANKEYADKIRVANFPPGLSNAMLYMGAKQSAAALADGVATQEIADGMAGLPMVFKKWGTSATTASQIPDGDSPSHNWLGVPDDIADESALQLDADTLLQNEVRKYHCYSCALGCGGIMKYPNNRYGKFTEGHKPEYESLGVFGTLSDNWDLDSICHCTELVNQDGMDSISAGAVVAWTIEMFERGIVTKEDLGFEITWGDSDGIVRLTEMLVNREGFGKIIYNGIGPAADAIGGEALNYKLTFGGIEPGMHDGRKGPGGWGAFYPLDATPGKHTTASNATLYMYRPNEYVESLSEEDLPSYNLMEEYVASGKMGRILANSYITRYILDGWGCCFLGVMTGAQHWNPLLFINAATGWNMTGDDLWNTGKNIIMLRQMFNAKHGYALDKIHVHERFEGGLTRGPLAYRHVPWEGHRYYTMQALKWDPDTGAPSNEAVEETGLNTLVEYDQTTTAVMQDKVKGA